MTPRLILLCLLFLATPALALTPDQILRQQQMIQQQQEQERQMEQNRLDIQEAKRIRAAREAEGVLPKTMDTVRGTASTDTASCPRFVEIYVTGNAVYAAEKLGKKILNKYIGKCINKTNMAAMQSEITKLYIDAGYTLARVYFDLNRMQAEGDVDTLYIVIEEGQINRISMTESINGQASEQMSEGKKKALDRQAWFAFPSAAGDTFNIRDFEQGLDQMNRLQSNGATMDVKPAADVVGASDVFILNQRSDRTTFYSLELNNSSTRRTGQNVGSVSVNKDNLMDISDNLFMKYAHDVMFDAGSRYNQSFYGNYSVPFGYWTFNASLSYSDYKTTVDGMYTSFHTTGSTLTGTMSADHVIYRNKFFKSNPGALVTLKDTKSYVRDAKSKIGSRVSSNINIYWNNTVYTPMGTIILKPSYQQGLDWFGSREDLTDLSRNAPRLQYGLMGLYAYYNTQINVPLLTRTFGKNTAGDNVSVRNKLPLSYTLTFDSQYSFDALYGTDQFSVGGLYTVRGFKDSTISGDNGYYIRNDVRASIRDLLPNALMGFEMMNYGADKKLSANNALARMYLAGFYDYGYVANKYKFAGDQYNSNSGYMAGAGVALHYYGDVLTWSLTYAKSLRAPDYLQTRDAVCRETHAVYWRAAVNF